MLTQESNGPTTSVEWVATTFEAMINFLNSGIIQVGPAFQHLLQPQLQQAKDEDMKKKKKKKNKGKEN